MNSTAPAPDIRSPAFRARIVREGKPVARAVLAARAFAKIERERVDAYVAPILARYAFTVDKAGRCSRAGQVITRSGDLYLSFEDARHDEFYAECDTAHRAHGFTGGAGYCPALIAETAVVRAEADLLKVAGALLGFGDAHVYGKTRDDIVETFISLAIKA